MKKGILLLMTLPLVVSSSWGGSEIGNGRYVDFKNTTGNFVTRYPKTWEHIDLGEIVGFSESDVPVQDASKVAISVNELFGIQTVENLKAFINVSKPNVILSNITLDGKKGFFFLSEGRAQIYILRNPGVIVQISYQIRADEQSRLDVSTIIQSLKF